MRAGDQMDACVRLHIHNRCRAPGDEFGSSNVIEGNDVQEGNVDIGI